MRPWWRSPWFVGPVTALGGVVVGIGSVVVAIRLARNTKSEIQSNMRQTGPSDFESRIGSTRLLFPAESWASARNAGIDFAEMFEHVQPQGWDVVADAARDLDLSEIYFTSLYRPEGTGPHTQGRGIDIGYVTRRGDPTLTLLRRQAGQPTIEPELARSLRVSLVRHGATQVLTPWWIYSVGTRDDPNDMRRELDVAHLSHLHITSPKS